MLILKPALAGALMLAQVTSAQPVPQHQHPLVKQVSCFVAKGTAFRVSPTQMLSVDHVTSNVMCAIEGEPVRATGEPGDFSIIATAPRKGNVLKIDCGGFKVGEYYWAIGHARGEARQTTIRLIATKHVATDGDYAGMVVLWGNPTVIPGMSGGPVLNSAGAVVGTVNAFDLFRPLSLSRQLKDTSICDGRTA